MARIPPPPLDLETVPVPTDRILPRDLPLEQGPAILASHPGPLLALRGPAGPEALLATSLRAALQGDGPAAVLGDLARPELVASSRAEAEARLGGAPVPDAVLFAGPGAPRVLQVRVPPVRVAVVMAGGEGTRLRPLTDRTPKPLLDVGGRPLLARTLDLLAGAGVKKVFLSIRYLGGQIRDAVGDGGSWGLEVVYLEEDRPLDTGAGLALLPGADAPFFLMNGDLLTEIDLQALARHHVLRHALATVATFRYAAPLPYGVVHAAGEQIRAIEEKPVFRYPVNAGIYVFSPAVLARVERGRPLAMVDFLNELARGEAGLGCFPLVEPWNDIGSHNDLARAREKLAERGE
ncbi:MAG: sugar phosphate nucleotidyltransferase [Planctomycetota bacterium]